MASLETMVKARAVRDVIRDALVNELSRCALSDMAMQLLAKDVEATEHFHRAWMEYQVAKAQGEAR